MKTMIWALVMLFLMPLTALADGPPPIDTGDTSWVLISTAFVLLMTAPGLALFYSGMVRRKNVLGTIMQSFAVLCIISIQWVLWGYSLAFGPDIGGLIGSLDWAGLAGVGADPNTDYAATIPHQAFMIFQMMFAVITPALIAGAFAERMKFSAFIIFTLLWTTLVYDPLAHWVWGVGGWLRALGALDFAGGTVVHISSGVAALAAALAMGKRKGYKTELMMPHNLPLTLIGAGLLWFGWFGFNAGSALGANGLAASAFLVTNTAAAAAALAWMAAEWLHRGKPTLLGLASGIVAGLVAITPAAGFVGPMPSIFLGAAAGVICYIAVTYIKPLLGYDDSLDAFGIHGVGGIWGAIATGLFASTAINSAGADGLFYGGTLLVKQLIAVGASVGYAFVATFVLLKLIDWTVGLRVSSEDEVQGLDITQHSESGYSL
ncbi:MAG TPA: ammonia channel protein [Deltaproteobacteria bacterium]|nr:MAG: ammonia channel protein [Deltaproteobacteria bacterium GWA2_55_82]OGQ64959.1 MAG: ammonia channel protein [Deltaproteobacteria bacterium RIFCSPLOWO2_02_FULL_55_12]OIJ73861.1 MAG: ammonia channel protein [Deltaproteobacteria bacterium GWC2_55_46]HBG46323.1 ammonia channel protein [Deltaproteobacteria bacterium]HCY09847.1 ammonia channel protein [Deltaproteobacteria bacterium]